MNILLVILGIVIAATVVLWIKALFGTPRNLYFETKFERAWLKLLDRVSPAKTR